MFLFSPARLSRRLSSLACAAAALLALAAGRADAGSSWAKGDKSQARLISAGGLVDGHYRVGIEIDLSGDALTYWRTPGEAGAPPSFRFDRSHNVADAQVFYPAPGRYLEAGATAWGYRHRVIFPLDVKPQDAARPATLAVDLQYAACETICIPAEAHLTLELSPAAPPSDEAALIAAFAARVPKPIGPRGDPPFKLWGVAQAAHPTWRVKLSPPLAPNAELFAEGPDGWYFDTRRSGDDMFDIVLAEKPADAKLPIDGVRLTIANGDKALEISTRLDAVPGKP